MKAEEVAPPELPRAPANVGEAILAVYQAVDSVVKTRAPGLGYSFASEAGIIAVLRGPMTESGLIAYVETYDIKVDEQFTTARGTTMNRIVVAADVRFLHAPSGTHIGVMSLGEGMDVGDKAVPKALTGALKYALRQTFLLEAEEADEPERYPSHEQERAAPRESALGRAALAAGARPAVAGAPNWTLFWSECRSLGLDRDAVHRVAEAESIANWSGAQIEELMQKLRGLDLAKGAQAQPPAKRARGETPALQPADVRWRTTRNGLALQIRCPSGPHGPSTWSFVNQQEDGSYQCSGKRPDGTWCNARVSLDLPETPVTTP